MKPYSFRLQTVLRVRRIEAMRADQRVGQAARELRGAERRERAHAELYEKEAVFSPEATAMSFTAEWERGLRLGAMMREATVQANARAVELSSAQAAATSAARSVTALEKLDHRHRGEWLATLRREEALELDDFATTRTAIAMIEADRVR